MLNNISNIKSMGKGTRILLYNGNYKLIEDIVIGDILIGYKNKPTRVLSTTRGKDILYKIYDIDTNYVYRVNKEHILTLYKKKKL